MKIENDYIFLIFSMLFLILNIVLLSFPSLVTEKIFYEPLIISLSCCIMLVALAVILIILDSQKEIPRESDA